MKKALIISSILFVVSLAAFIVSVGATGIQEGTEISVFFGGEYTEINKEFSANEIKNIDLAIASGNVVVKTADVESATVKYSGRHIFAAEIVNDTLAIKEKSNWFGIIGINFDDYESRLEVVLPEREYGNVNVKTASGECEIDNLICENFNSSAASGDNRYRIFAENIDINVASGSVYAENCTDRKAEKVNLKTASGDHTIKGFTADSYNIKAASGDISAEGISGRCEVNLVSGDVNIEYAQWDGDLTIDAASGNVDVTLPENSGAEVSLDRLSGDIYVELDDKKVKLDGNADGIIIGGENVNDVDVDLGSGKINIHN